MKKIILILGVIVGSLVLIIFFFLSSFQPQSKVTDLKAGSSSCYFSQDDLFVKLNLSWKNKRNDTYYLYYGGELKEIKVNKTGSNRYRSLTALKVDECPRKDTENEIALLKTLSNDNYYEVPFSISLNAKKEYDFSLYGCVYPYYGNFKKGECFVDSKSIDPFSEINIHGDSTDKEPGDWESLFVVFENCSTCKFPAHIKLETATLSNTQCELSVTADVNNVGTYNLNVFPGKNEYKYHELETRDSVEIPIKKHVKKGVKSFRITPNPAGCNLRLDSFRIVY